MIDLPEELRRRDDGERSLVRLWRTSRGEACWNVSVRVGDSRADIMDAVRLAFEAAEVVKDRLGELRET